MPPPHEQTSSLRGMMGGIFVLINHCISCYLNNQQMALQNCLRQLGQLCIKVI